MCYLFVFLLLLPDFSKANVRDPEDLGLFSGRINRVERRARFIRVHTDFKNIRYLNKKDKVEFWSPGSKGLKCNGIVLGKSNDYFLLKIPDLKRCLRIAAITQNAYLHFYSKDLVNNITMGVELLEILKKKHGAINGRLEFEKKEINRHIEKVNAVNARYKVLREKLETEWRNEISALEEDKNITLENYKNLQIELDKIVNKLEKYKIEDDNFHEDRWALDPQYYIRK